MRWVVTLGSPGGRRGLVALEGVAAQTTPRAPRDPRLKRERRMFGLSHAGSAALFRITHS